MMEHYKELAALRLVIIDRLLAEFRRDDMEGIWTADMPQAFNLSMIKADARKGVFG